MASIYNETLLCGWISFTKSSEPWIPYLLSIFKGGCENDVNKQKIGSDRFLNVFIVDRLPQGLHMIEIKQNMVVVVSMLSIWSL